MTMLFIVGFLTPRWRRLQRLKGSSADPARHTRAVQRFAGEPIGHLGAQREQPLHVDAGGRPMLASM